MNKVIWIVILFVIGFNSSRLLAVDQAFFTSDNLTPLVGEPVQLILHIRVPREVQVRLPDFVNNWQPFMVKEAGSLQKVNDFNDGSIEYQLPITVILWQPGQYSTPPLIVSYQIVGTIPVNLEIASLQFTVPTVLRESDLSLRPLKSQIDVPYFPIWMLFFAIGLVVVIVITVTRSRLTPKLKPKANAEPLTNAWAHHALISLKQIGQSDSPSTIYAQCSDCLRSYLDARFTVITQGLTTPELIQRLDEQHVLDTENQRKLVDILKRADLVKFAHVIPKLNAAQQFASLSAQWIMEVEQTHHEHLL